MDHYDPIIYTGAFLWFLVLVILTPLLLISFARNKVRNLLKSG